MGRTALALKEKKIRVELRSYPSIGMWETDYLYHTYIHI